jgi:hypothetical protein
MPTLAQMAAQLWPMLSRAQDVSRNVQAVSPVMNPTQQAALAAAQAQAAGARQANVDARTAGLYPLAGRAVVPPAVATPPSSPLTPLYPRAPESSIQGWWYDPTTGQWMPPVAVATAANPQLGPGAMVGNTYYPSPPLNQQPGGPTTTPAAGFTYTGPPIPAPPIYGTPGGPPIPPYDPYGQGDRPGDRNPDSQRNNRQFGTW